MRGARRGKDPGRKAGSRTLRSSGRQCDDLHHEHEVQIACRAGRFNKRAEPMTASLIGHPRGAIEIFRRLGHRVPVLPIALGDLIESLHQTARIGLAVFVQIALNFGVS